MNAGRIRFALWLMVPILMCLIALFAGMAVIAADEGVTGQVVFYVFVWAANMFALWQVAGALASFGWRRK